MKEDDMEETVEFSDVIKLQISEEGRLELTIITFATCTTAWLNKTQLHRLISRLKTIESKVTRD